jgi:hypothetical protein
MMALFGTVFVVKGACTHCVGDVGLVLLFCVQCWYTLYWWCWFGTVIVMIVPGTNCTGGVFWYCYFIEG